MSNTDTDYAIELLEQLVDIEEGIVANDDCEGTDIICDKLCHVLVAIHTSSEKALETLAIWLENVKKISREDLISSLN